MDGEKRARSICVIRALMDEREARVDIVPRGKKLWSVLGLVAVVSFERMMNREASYPSLPRALRDASRRVHAPNGGRQYFKIQAFASRRA
jgi:hypothetical protein